MGRAKLKIAVVGTGPAGLGVLHSLLQNPQNNPQITVFEAASPVETIPFESEINQPNIAEYYSTVYEEIRRRFKFEFPPPKTHFAMPLDKYTINGKPGIFRSRSFGGLSNYWGGGLLPFTDNELESWPVNRSQLDPYYKSLAAAIGISGRRDALNDYFGDDFVNRPPMPLTRVTRLLDRTVNTVETGNTKYRIVSGICRCALETRDTHPNHCRICGECLAGCFAGSIYNTKNTIQKYLENTRVNMVRGMVHSVNSATGSVHVYVNNSLETFSGFARIFLAAGCPGSTQIVLHSTGMREVNPIVDNAVYVFPVFYLGKITEYRTFEPYTSLCNLVWGLIPREHGLKFAQGSLYLNFDYLWRYNIPSKVWKTVRSLVAWSRHRLFWLRLYVHGDDSQAYSIRLENDHPVFEYAHRARKEVVKDMITSIRESVNRSGFYMPSLNILQKTNSHYAATLPMGGSRIAVSDMGQIMPGVYVCDSSIFPDLPAVPLTFTIMANAARIAAETI